MAEILLQGQELVKQFPVQKAPFTGRVLKNFTAVDGVSLELYRGETLGIPEFGKIANEIVKWRET